MNTPLVNQWVETQEFGTITIDVHNPIAKDGWWVAGEIILHNRSVRVVKEKHGPWQQQLRRVEVAV